MREANDTPQRRAVVAAAEPVGEPVGQSEVEQAGRSGVQPVGLEAEISGDQRSRVSNRRRQRLGRHQLPMQLQGNDVHVLRAAGDGIDGQQAAATDDHEMGLAAGEGKLFAERRQRRVESERVDVRHPLYG
jgi:hypothetical protein